MGRSLFSLNCIEFFFVVKVKESLYGDTMYPARREIRTHGSVRGIKPKGGYYVYSTKVEKKISKLF